LNKPRASQAPAAAKGEGVDQQQEDGVLSVEEIKEDREKGKASEHPP
jgi:hypothetical protein